LHCPIILSIPRRAREQEPEKRIMVEAGKTYVVMGLLDPSSIAYAIGQVIQAFGGTVVYTMQNERMKRLIFDRSKDLSSRQKDELRIEFCDVTDVDQVQGAFDRIGPMAGVVHSIAFANPRTCLGEEYHTNAFDDLKAGFHISVVSLATVTHYAGPYMDGGGSVVALTFSSDRAWPYYNWMSVNKAALEANVRGLARRHGRDRIRVNAISAGPLMTRAAGAIPGFKDLGATWERISPLPWDPEADQKEVAHAAAFLLGPYAAKITGQTIHVDGGASITGGDIQPFERADG
jgi:enoyl-[acyl-carrier protein] reductase I